MFNQINNSYLKLLIWVFFLSILSASFHQCTQDYSSTLPKKVDFNFHVKPILVQKCFLCHGPDPSSREGDLRLDTFEGATALLEEGRKAIDPGHPGKSEVVKRINYDDPNLVMPPPESNLELSQYEIDILTKWIDQGAEWKPHWSFIPPKITEPEKFNNSVNEIDDYIEEKIVSKKLNNAPTAGKNSLIRRVSYLLTGLPPTPKKLNNYLADSSANAYEKMVDHYLNDEAFGERWARHWMDITRYAETKGHEFDYSISGAWQYRDYLIRAFNEDVPYDQLVKEQIAGDLLDTVRWNPENGMNESQLGTIFYTLGEGKHSPVDIKKEEVDRIDNIIDVTTKAFQGLTVSCAKCHDHKFDPVPTSDYYSLYGIFESTRISPQPTNVTYHQQKDIDAISALKDSIKIFLASKWENQKFPLSSELKQMSNEVSESSDFEILGDFRGANLDGWKSDGLAFGKRTTLGNPVFGKNSQLTNLSTGKASSKTFGPGIFGALRSPDFIIEKDFIGVKALGKKAIVRIIIDNFQLIQDPIYGGLTKKVEADEWTDLKFNVAAWKGHKAYVEIIPGQYNKHVYQLPKEAFVEAKYIIAFNGDWPQVPTNESFEKPVEMNTALENWAQNSASPEEIRAINQLIATNQFRGNYHQINTYSNKINQLQGQMQDTSFFEGITDGFAINSKIFIRGSHNELSKNVVPRGFLSGIFSKNQFRSEGSGRMELANAIVDPENPLTSRVMVNRIWHYLFGRGLVETVDNFGLQGKLPSHPELLDFLALKFQNEGYSIKQMIKYMVMSQTFRRAVEVPDGNKSNDPDNLYLANFPIRRLESEAIRDALLMVAGNLDETMYGAPVPVYLTPFMQGRGRPYRSGPMDGNGRRSIYLEVRRNFLQPMMLTFDRPIPFSTFGKRNVTNVPAQSLILMNDPFVEAQAGLLAQEIVNEKNLDIDEKIDVIYLRTLSRNAKSEEKEQAKVFIQSLAKNAEIPEQELLENTAIWKAYCHSIFNLKEFIYLI
ncbi:PSD1 and planctomycete cytochrome C domain-containing protein [Flexithrix dorotheae]|uniref:PSD1 and planctomycete cytochrome C domain-containing protein n=1 Tax=Flexithrix dorotheae TaxID=70993 RepID=UPI001FE21775|nr:PSD1 and planctomycete cytochrome C domain-containing protein [Flexithrix dorotheae]